MCVYIYIYTYIYIYMCIYMCVYIYIYIYIYIYTRCAAASQHPASKAPRRDRRALGRPPGRPVIVQY